VFERNGDITHAKSVPGVNQLIAILIEQAEAASVVRFMVPADAVVASMVRAMPARPKRPKPRAPVPPDAPLRSRARKILSRLAKAYPDWGPTLDFTSPLELLVATILAAQAQDERINQVTRALFVKYRSPADYAAAPKGVLEKDIKATGFFNLKAKRLRAMARGLLDEFGGEVPSDMDGLTRLDGVGRKTASIVLGAAFGVPAVAVDRHVARVAVGRVGKRGVPRERFAIACAACGAIVTSRSDALRCTMRARSSTG